MKTRRTSRLLLSCVTALALLPVTALAQAQPQPFVPDPVAPVQLSAPAPGLIVPGYVWQIEPYVRIVAGQKQETSCSFYNTYTDGHKVRFIGGVDRLRYIIIDAPVPAFSQGQVYPVQIELGAAFRRLVAGVADTPVRLVIDVSAFGKFGEALRASDYMGLSLGQTNLRFSLSGLRPVISVPGLRDCSTLHKSPDIMMAAAAAAVKDAPGAPAPMPPLPASPPLPQSSSVPPAPLVPAPLTPSIPEMTSAPPMPEERISPLPPAPAPLPQSVPVLQSAPSRPLPPPPVPAAAVPPPVPHRGAAVPPPQLLQRAPELSVAELMTSPPPLMTEPADVAPPSVPEAQVPALAAASAQEPLPPLELPGIRTMRSGDPMDRDIALLPSASIPTPKPKLPLRPLDASTTWYAMANEDVHDVLARWSGKAGVQLVWNSDKATKVGRDLQIKGTYSDAVRFLLEETGASRLYKGDLGAFNGAPDASAAAQSVTRTPDAEAGKRVHWYALEGAGLESVLDMWTRKAGVILLWDTTMTFSVRKNINTETDFDTALRGLMRQFDDQPVRPKAEIYRDPASGRRVLVVGSQQ